jgi:hypothetical protein
VLKFHFRPGKSAFMALVLAAAALLCGWQWLSEGGVFALLFLVLCGVGAAKLMSDAVGGAPALAVDDEGLRIRRTWGSVVAVPWRQVQHIGVEVMTLRYLGIIPVARHETLVVACDGGLFGTRRLRLALKMVELPRGGTAELLALLQAAHVGAVGVSAVAMAGAGANGWGADSAGSLSGSSAELDQGGGFDADAALQRYLAKRDSSAVATAATPAPPARPPRPSFGRKASA